MLKQIAVTPRIVQTSGGSSGHKGGSQIGSLAGAAIGAATGTGVAGMAAGASLGGLIGGAIDPAKAGKDAIVNRIDASQPQFIHSENADKLKQSLLALQQAPQNVRDEYGPQLVHAYLSQIHNDNVGGVA